MTREELEKRLAKDPRFRLVRDPGKGFIIPAEAAPRPKDFSLVPWVGGLSANRSQTSAICRPQNAQRSYERYLALARAEALSGNMIGAENYYQHAEHYFRSMASDRGTT